jgi:putative transposase
MTEIITLTICLAPYVSKTQLRQLQHVIMALLCIPGRVTMLSLSRWSEDGGSYRTIQRWFQTTLDWGLLLWVVIKAHLLDPNGLYLLAGDDVVVSKAGKKTYGVGRFYSSIAQRPIPSLSFFALSLIDVNQRRSYPVGLEQHIPVEKGSKAPENVSQAVKRGRGRPKGSKSHAKTEPTLSAELTLLQSLLRVVLKRIAPLPVKHLVLDGYFGTYPVSWVVRDCDLHLISKLRHNAALYFPYNGPKPKRGPTARYGTKLDYKALPESARCSSVTEAHVVMDTYQMTVLHKDFPEPLNVVILVRTDSRTHKSSHVVLFSTDLSLTAAQITDYYSLRFQIEFNFRDAKQYWGLEDFMNVSPTAVTNAANLAFLMVNLSAVLLPAHRQQQPDFSVFDLKMHFRTRRYLREVIKSLPDPPASDFISRLGQRLSALGGIRPYADLQDAA